MYAVILAGGGGTRLWPLSRPECPKPFLPLTGPETLFQRTVARLVERPGALLSPRDVFVVTDRRYADLVREQARDADGHSTIGGVVEEPAGRNTAAAIALAALAIEREPDDVMVVLPADQAIRDEPLFRATLRAAGLGLAGGAFGIARPLVTLGIEVTRPATEYGYLLPDVGRGDVLEGLQAYPLAGFQEKPGIDRAGELLRMPGVAWNAGIFAWRRDAIQAALRAHAPDIVGVLEAGLATGQAAALDAAYRDVRSISIDYAVMEPAATAGHVVMGSMDVGWTDLGGWPALLEANGASPCGHVVQDGEPVTLGAEDLLVEREPDGLRLRSGPGGTIRSTGPTALLQGAARDRARIEALLERVNAREAHTP